MLGTPLKTDVVAADTAVTTAVTNLAVTAVTESPAIAVTVKILAAPFTPTDVEALTAATDAAPCLLAL